MKALARDQGYSLVELVGTETKFSRAPAAARYHCPENPGLTWSGRGRKPLKFVKALEMQFKVEHNKVSREVLMLDGVRREDDAVGRVGA